MKKFLTGLMLVCFFCSPASANEQQEKDVLIKKLINLMIGTGIEEVEKRGVGIYEEVQQKLFLHNKKVTEERCYPEIMGKVVELSIADSFEKNRIIQILRSEDSITSTYKVFHEIFSLEELEVMNEIRLKPHDTDTYKKFETLIAKSSRLFNHITMRDQLVGRVYRLSTLEAIAKSKLNQPEYEEFLSTVRNMDNTEVKKCFIQAAGKK